MKNNKHDRMEPKTRWRRDKMSMEHRSNRVVDERRDISEHLEAMDNGEDMAVIMEVMYPN